MKQLPNLLIVDDMEANLLLLKSIMRSLNVNLISALSGEEALQKTHGVDLVLAILDVRMPEMNGYELAVKLNEKRGEQKVPVIFLTASDNNTNDEIEGYCSGAVDYLYKPISNHILLSKIKIFLDLYNHKQIIVREAAKLEKATDELIWSNAALQRSEAKYRGYIESAPDGVFVTDENGCYTDINEAACRMTGYAKGELLKMSFVDFFPEAYKKLGLSHFRKLVKLGELKGDLPFKHKNDSTRWWSLVAVKLSENRYLSYTHDITMRIEMEESLRAYQIELELQNKELEIQNEEIMLAKKLAEIISHKYTELYNFAPTGYFTLSAEKEINELNISGARMIGKNQAVIKGLHFGLFVSQTSLAQFNVFFQEILEMKLKKTCEIVLQTNHEKPITVHIEGILDKNNEQVLLNVIDITELKKIEKVLRESEKKYRTMLNASPDGIFLIDMSGIIREVSDIGLELLHIDKKEEILGNLFSLFVSMDEKNTIQEIFKKTIRDGICQNMEIKISRRNNSLFLADICATLIQDIDGKPLSYMIIMRDISFKKEIQARQIHADRMANLGQMASGIAHEINQPLNIISMVMDKLLFDAAKSGTVELTFLQNRSKKIFENITRISNIIDHVRIFSRSHEDYIMTNFDINTSIKNACSMLMEQFKHLGIQLSLALDPQIPTFVGNTNKFEQVIINLLVNAKDAVIEKENKVKGYKELMIGIKTWQEDHFLLIEISDNGIGIEQEVINNVMLPFYTTKEEGKGTGLGLSICYQIINEMNGTMEIKSERLIGTKNIIKLNLNK